MPLFSPWQSSVFSPWQSSVFSIFQMSAAQQRAKRGAAPEGSSLSRGVGRSLGCAAGDTQRSPPASEIIPEKKFITAVPKRSYCRGQVCWQVERKGQSFPHSLRFPKEASQETADPFSGLIYSLHQKETTSLCLSFITQTGTEMMGSPSWQLTLTVFPFLLSYCSSQKLFHSLIPWRKNTLNTRKK